MKTKKVPPSRIRYDASNPIISIRIDLKLKQDLEKLRADTGKSLADILREAVERNHTATMPEKSKPVAKLPDGTTVYMIKTPEHSSKLKPETDQKGSEPLPEAPQ